MRAIAHISDLHFGRHDPLIAEALLADLAAEKPDLVAVSGDPLKVYLSFVPIPDTHGDALLVIALFDDRRIEVRMLRGGTNPLYGIWAMTPQPDGEAGVAGSAPEALGSARNRLVEMIDRLEAVENVCVLGALAANAT